jgi:predicted metal-dependent phosphoesterase TrpH/glycosyltransferase involved in cell wall biosynthesis
LGQSIYPDPVPGPEPLSIAHVTPHPWGPHHEVNDFVERVSEELRERGHRVLIAAPSDSRAAIRASRAAIREARGDPAPILEGTWGERAADGLAVLAVGQGIPMPRGPRPRAAPMPLDVSRTLERLLGSVPFDIVHVHDPFGPSAASAALRHSHSLNVGSFHEPTERVLSTQVARPLVEVFFGRLDARTVSCRGTGELLERYFPGSYELIRPGADRVPEADAAWPRRRSGPSRADGDRPLRIAFCVREERGALRLFLRALRRLALEADWEVAIWSDAPGDQMLRMNRRLRERVRITGPSEGTPEQLLAGADVLCVASGGPRPAPGLVRAALAAGAVPVASHLGIYEELTEDGELGLLFPSGDPITLAGQLGRLISEPDLRRRLRRAAGRRERSWSETAAELEEVYRRVCARRHDPRGEPAIRRRLAARPSIHCDLHMHTDHSPDCATPVEVLLETARYRGLGAIAVTDHNEISGALEARELAERMDGIKVIVAEEVKTAEEGEVIGLFLEEKIPRGLTMAQTIAEIRRQGGLVYVPHPFDRLHSVPDYEHLLKIVEEIDILEVFNPRIAFSAFNEEAERFAAKYRIVPGAGSDSHVAQGLGSVRIRLHDFDGPEEFLEAMRDADIIHKHRNLIYVQALKLLQTTGRSRAGRRVRAAKPPRTVRGGRRRAARRASLTRSGAAGRSRGGKK